MRPAALTTEYPIMRSHLYDAAFYDLREDKNESYNQFEIDFDGR